MNRPIRGVLVGAVALLGGLSCPSTSMAAPPETVTEYKAYMECTGTTSGGEPVFVTTGTSPQFGDQLYARVGDPEEPRLTAYSVSGGWEGREIAFDLEVFAGGGGGHLEPPLLGSFTATTTETPTTEYTDRGGSGNQHVRATIVEATLTAEAVLSLPGVTVDSLNCSGSSTTSTYVSNSPASTVRFERRFYDSARCQGNAEVALFGPEDGKYYLSVEFGEPNNQYNLSGVIEEPNDKSFTIVLPLRNSQTGEVLGEYEVAVTLTPRDKATTTVLRTATARITQRTTLYDVSAQVTLPSIDIDASCEALEVTTREIVRAAQGPKPTATPPPNDALAGAPRIAVGDTVRTTTRDAVLLPEAPLSCATNPGRTVWYSFVGTGEPVHLDTAGSSFDTALAVYEKEGGELLEIACADDVEQDDPFPTETLQAQLDVPTTAGRTYYVQVAGVYADYGRLVLSLD
ncbi:MAG TPA: hypothetical protein VE462_15500 [Propionibacteriaceae bacterium]|nr:hypothetical protein [Propionibacteriaceae bacterium]